MKQLLIKLLAFAAFNIALLLFACEIALPEPASTSLYKRRIAESHLDADTLILGSSHAAMAIIPRSLPGSAVNLASPSQDLYYDSEIALRYIPRMPRLRRVVMEVSFFSWEGGLSANVESWREELYYRAFGIPPQHWSWKTGFYSRIACYGFNRAAFLLKEPNRFDADGWLKKVATFDPGTGKIAANRHVSNLRIEHAASNLERVATVVRECRTRGIEVVLVTFPAHECYRAALNPDTQRRMQDVTRRFCEENLLRHLDYMDDERFAAEDFADGDHLNFTGANKFTRILQSDLQPQSKYVAEDSEKLMR